MFISQFDKKTDISIVMTDGKDEICFNGKDAFVTSFNINFDNCYGDLYMIGTASPFLLKLPGVITLDFTIEIPTLDANGNSNWEQIVYSKKQEKKIREKKVEDCSIEELLFACKKKMEIRKNGSEN